ncbi:HK97 family phage prohead protease [Anaerotruncus sp. 1XD42-93]|uniref:HK97 family phage prohead protease n=1 Tax=Anaerotruncus sp. 1XD42-93 TaxID=2320853 RepID=UPI000EA3FC15|nr:HK97 family phage prohead protease [Anaerotruncus sp. 1XD42-93]NBK18189.1 caudovirus prohead protease [Anaerotruncus sp. 1XD42-93]NCE73424.1 caudovirus prohead protease [Anaerotruncus sp. X29]RKJ92349.1 caudovirus prohead protease [Anaerotruncus sp. 1XD22-93]
MAKFDFSGWATRNDLQCADGRIIRKNAFKQQDGETVSLVWNHQHDSQDNVLGHALLENRDDGVYAYCTFNDTESGQTAKKLVRHGDVVSLSIAANQLKQMGKDVVHGIIREVSLVLAGANPGAYIDTVMNHGVAVEDELIINYNENIMLYHSDDGAENKDKKPDDGGSKEENPENDDETVDEVMERIRHKLSDKEQDVVFTMIGMAALDKKGGSEDNNDSKGGNEDMKHNVFDKKGKSQDNVLSHAAQSEILKLAKSSSVGSLQAAIKIYSEEHELQHADISGFLQTGNGNITTMFPEYVEAHPSRTPELITNDMGWVDAIMAKTQKIPHGRVRTSHVDIRNIDALSAKGYQKGNEKKITGNYELVRRTTDPQTVYVTSELHRDDVVDIEDFDYVQFQYSIDQISLKETLAVATMLGDERPNSDPEKIFPDKIRPIWTDDELYTIHKDVDFAAMAKELQGANTEQYFGESFIYAEAMVTALRKARKDFRGTGKPDLFITTDMHNTMILARDRNGRRIYETDTELAAALGVANIYEVTQFEGKVRTDSDGVKHKLHAICVNMADYGYGASKGGDVTHFTDFDIKFNQLQSLLETRKSGQLTRIKSAIVIEEKAESVSG